VKIFSIRFLPKLTIKAEADVKEKISRRSFLKVSSAAGAGAAIGLGAATRTARAGVRDKQKNIQRIPSVCEQCFWRCGIICTVEDGRLKKIEGNPKHPNNKGKICARGNAGVSLLYEKDRLTDPMIRVGERGSGQWRKVSWEEALDYTAENMKKVTEKYGIESHGLFYHGASAKFMVEMFENMGNDNIVAPSFAQCRGPRDVGYDLTFGESLGSPERLDLGNADVIVLIGSSLGENVHTGQIIDFTNAIAKGTKIITVDPRFSTAASKSKHWLPIKPGTDTALVLSWIREVINRGGYDGDFVRNQTSGFAQLKRHVQQFTPEWAEKITEIPAGQIRETARMMMAAKPAVVIHPGRHVTWYGNDVQRARAMAILAALLGTWGQKGGYFLSSRSAWKTRKLPVPKAPKMAAKRADGTHWKFPFAGHEGVTQELIKATLNEDPYPIKSWMVFGQNIFNSIPDKPTTRAAIDKLDFYAVVDIRPIEAIWYADVILPEDTYLERHDNLLAKTGWYEQYVSLRQPVVERLHNTRPGWWIAKELGKRLGLGEYYPFEEFEDVLRYELKDSGVDYEQLKRDGVVTFPGKPYLNPGENYRFKTADRKVQFYSNELKKYGFDPMPKFEPVNDPENGYFRLVYGMMPTHSHGKTQSNPWLNNLKPEPFLWLNETLARSMGIKNMDEVVLENQDGVRSDKVKVMTTPGIRGDVVYLPHGFGGNKRGLLNFTTREVGDNHLMTKYTVDPICGGNGLRVNFVRLLQGEEHLIPTATVSFTGVLADKFTDVDETTEVKEAPKVVKEKVKVRQEVPIEDEDDEEEGC
jgi:thiosulfate reductase/polysulfide reductase chain A